MLNLLKRSIAPKKQWFCSDCEVTSYNVVIACMSSLPVIKLKIHHARGSLGSAVVHFCLDINEACCKCNKRILACFTDIFSTNDRIHKKFFTLFLYFFNCLVYKTDENIHNPPPSVLPHDTQPFLSVCRKYVQCGESPAGGF